jgi:hypothetical protein
VKKLEWHLDEDAFISLMNHTRNDVALSVEGASPPPVGIDGQEIAYFNDPRL